MSLPPRPLFHTVLSSNSRVSLHALDPTFTSQLSSEQYNLVVQAFMKLDHLTQGAKTPREFQLRTLLALHSGKDVIVHAGTGYGKTLAMILPMLLDSSKLAVTVSPLKVLHKSHVSLLDEVSAVIQCLQWDRPMLSILQFTRPCY